MSDPVPPSPPAARRRKAATIRDVAQAVGVSTATVSKFINGGQRFSREVEDRLTAAIRELGLTPFHRRSFLALQRTLAGEQPELGLFESVAAVPRPE